MKTKYSKYISKLFFKQWIIGICQENIQEILRTKTFDPKIHWIDATSSEKFYADPFPISYKNGKLKILYEEYSYEKDYGTISLMTIDKDFRPIDNKILLDTNSHLSYPFYHSENIKTHVFPESADNDKLSCYEFSHEHESLVFMKDILDIPLYDSTILKYDNKYWIFGVTGRNSTSYKLAIFYSKDRK